MYNENRVNLLRPLLVLLIVTTLLVLFGCADNNTTTTKRPGEAKQRIYGKEETYYAGVTYQIIEVDGIEYITSNLGGIYILVKDNKQ